VEYPYLFLGLIFTFYYYYYLCGLLVGYIIRGFFGYSYLLHKYILIMYDKRAVEESVKKRGFWDNDGYVALILKSLFVGFVGGFCFAFCDAVVKATLRSLTEQPRAPEKPPRT